MSRRSPLRTAGMGRVSIVAALFLASVASAINMPSVRSVVIKSPLRGGKPQPPNPNAKLPASLDGVEMDSSALKFFRSSMMAPTQHLLNMMGHQKGQKVTMTHLQALHGKMQANQERVKECGQLFPMRFRYMGAPGQHTVQLVGSWSDWLMVHNLEVGENGEWVMDLLVPGGDAIFKFLIDGEWALGEYEVVDDGFGNRNNKAWVDHTSGGTTGANTAVAKQKAAQQDLILKHLDSEINAGQMRDEAAQAALEAEEAKEQERLTAEKERLRVEEEKAKQKLEEVARVEAARREAAMKKQSEAAAALAAQEALDRAARKREEEGRAEAARKDEEWRAAKEEEKAIAARQAAAAAAEMAARQEAKKAEMRLQKEVEEAEKTRAKAQAAAAAAAREAKKAGDAVRLAEEEAAALRKAEEERKEEQARIAAEQAKKRAEKVAAAQEAAAKKEAKRQQKEQDKAQAAKEEALKRQAASKQQREGGRQDGKTPEEEAAEAKAAIAKAREDVEAAHEEALKAHREEQEAQAEASAEGGLSRSSSAGSAAWAEVEKAAKEAARLAAQAGNQRSKWIERGRSNSVDSKHGEAIHNTIEMIEQGTGERVPALQRRGRPARSGPSIGDLLSARGQEVFKSLSGTLGKARGACEHVSSSLPAPIANTTFGVAAFAAAPPALAWWLVAAALNGPGASVSPAQPWSVPVFAKKPEPKRGAIALDLEDVDLGGLAAKAVVLGAVAAAAGPIVGAVARAREGGGLRLPELRLPWETRVGPKGEGMPADGLVQVHVDGGAVDMYQIRPSHKISTLLHDLGVTRHPYVKVRGKVFTKWDSDAELKGLGVGHGDKVHVGSLDVRVSVQGKDGTTTLLVLKSAQVQEITRTLKLPATVALAREGERLNMRKTVDEAGIEEGCVLDMCEAGPGGVADQIDVLATKCKGALGGLRAAAAKAGDGVVAAAGDLAGGVKGAVVAVGDGAKVAGGAVMAGAKGAASSVRLGERLGSAASGVKGFAGALAAEGPRLRSRVGDTVGGLGGNVGGAVAAGWDGVVAAASEVGSAGGALVEGGKGAALKVGDEVGKATGEIARKVGEADVATAVGSALGGAAGEVGNAVGGVGRGVGSALGGAIGGVGKAVGGSVGGVGKRWEEMGVSRTPSAVGRALLGAVGGVSKAFVQAGRRLGGARDGQQQGEPQQQERPARKSLTDFVRGVVSSKDPKVRGAMVGGGAVLGFVVLAVFGGGEEEVARNRFLEFGQGLKSKGQGAWGRVTSPKRKAAAPRPAAPKPAAPRPSPPKQVAPKPASPKPAAPKPASPKPAAPKAAAPKPAAPKPAAPKPSPPKQVAPRPAAPKPKKAEQKKAAPARVMAAKKAQKIEKKAVKKLDMLERMNKSVERVGEPITLPSWSASNKGGEGALLWGIAEEIEDFKKKVPGAKDRAMAWFVATFKELVKLLTRVEEEASSKLTVIV